METGSEKRRRGRPRAEHSFLADQLAPFGKPDLRSHRGKQNYALAIRAWGMLSKSWEDRFAWFWSLAPMPWAGVQQVVASSAPHRVRWGVLTELGRLFDNQILVVARRLSVLPSSTTTRDAAARVRHCRTGAVFGTTAGLTGALTTALDEYLQRFPETTEEKVMEAIRRLELAVRRSFAGE